RRGRSRRVRRGRAPPPGRARHARTHVTLPRAHRVFARSHRDGTEPSEGERVRPDPQARRARASRRAAVRARAARLERRRGSRLGHPSPVRAPVSRSHSETLAPPARRRREHRRLGRARARGDRPRRACARARRARGAGPRERPRRSRRGHDGDCQASRSVVRTRANSGAGRRRRPRRRSRPRRAHAGHPARPRHRRAPLAALVGAQREQAPHRVAHRRAHARRHGDPARGRRRAASAHEGVLRVRGRFASSRPGSCPTALPRLVDDRRPGPLPPVIGRPKAGCKSGATLSAMTWDSRVRWVFALGTVLGLSVVPPVARAGTGETIEASGTGTATTVDPEASRIAAAGHSLKWNWTPPGHADRYGHAETLIHAPLASVRQRVMDYAHYKDILPSKFKSSRVVGHVVVEGRMLPGKGNVQDFDVVWTMHALDAQWTVLKLDLLLKPGLPAPQSAVDEELRDSARYAVDMIHDRSQGSGGVGPWPG